MQYIKQRIIAEQMNKSSVQNNQDIKPTTLETRLAAMNHNNMMSALNSDEEDKHDRHNRHDGDDLNDSE